MSKGILIMHNSNDKRLEEIIHADEQNTKRTTIILNKKERAFIDSLIQDGKELGIKPFISKMIDIYKNMTIYDWRFPGEYYCGISRVAFVNAELLNIMLQQIPKDKWAETGKLIGTALRISMEATLGLKAVKSDNWERVFQRLRVQGFGDLYQKDKYILIKTPILSHVEIWEGLLEGILSADLEIKTIGPPLVFEIKETHFQSTQ